MLNLDVKYLCSGYYDIELLNVFAYVNYFSRFKFVYF